MLKQALIVILLFCSAALCGDVCAQPRIARYQPDALAPGMTIALEILSFEKDSGAFGRDGVAPNDVRIVLNNPLDSDRVIIGPHVVSWNGRLIQVPIIIPFSAAYGTVDLHVERGIEKTDSIRLHIVAAGPPILITGSGLLGDGVNGSLTDRNTMVVQRVELSSLNPLNDLSRFAVTDLNGRPENKRMHPITILSRGLVRINATTLSVSADTINGGPGGGGGGAGYVGVGGYGYTGGGSSDTEFVQPATNVGSASSPVGIDYGGPSTTGVRGGKSDDTDQGGGGGTGNPFGTSGLNGGQNSPSFDGGYGGGSAGGESPSGPFGGGGGGFASAGTPGTGNGDNGGRANGGRFLTPIMGGSAGGAGNSFFREELLEAGAGGGGGGALTIISYQQLDIFRNAVIAANGANGESGKHDREGGGGGGSGGGLLLAARILNGLDSGSFIARGGIGGNGGGTLDSAARGGNGGIGRLRFDAPISDTCKTCFGKTVYGPTLSLPTSPVSSPTIKLSGFAGAGNDLADSVRIYYRTRRTPWNRTNALRIKANNVYTWETTINTPPDSLLFVCVYIKVRAPQHQFANYEPDWLMGHLSSGVISIEARSQLVVSPDTLDLGCTKTGTCLEALAYVENRGEAALQIDTVYTVSDSRFKIVAYPKMLLGYDPKSITVRYCPLDPPEADTAQLVIITGPDTTRKTIFVGCGLDKDRRIAITVPTIDFGEVHAADSCAERNFVIRSVGEDPVTVNLGNLIRPPFQIVEPDTSSTIQLKGAPDFVEVRVRFCPQDSGSFAETFIVSERRDSFIVRGVGTRKIFFAPDTVWLGEHCQRTCIDTSFLVYSVGNDGFTLNGVLVSNGTTLLHPLNRQDLPSAANDRVELRICFNNVGEFFSSIIYDHTADSASSTRSTVLRYRVNGLSLEHEPVVDLGAVCTGSCDSLITSISNRSSRFTITSVELQDTIFTPSLAQLPYEVVEDSSFTIKLSVCPPGSGEFFDTLKVHIQQGDCDTTIFIPVHAFSADAALELSAPSILFDIADSGSCLRDTVSLGNPCENDVLVTLPIRVGVFSRIAPAASQITVAGGSAIDLIYEFCPLDSNLHQAEDTIRFNGSSVRLPLSGKGRVPEDVVSPYIRFALGHVDNGVVPETFSYKIAIDSIFAGNLITSVSGELHFDPIVVLPREITSDHVGWQITGTETTPGIFGFTATRMSDIVVGPFATINMQALRSRRDTTAVILYAPSMHPQGSVAADTGSIKTNACEVPPPNIIIPGAYKLGDPSPNPLRSQLLVPITIGAEGILKLKLYTAQGALILSKNELIAKGDHHLSVDVSTIAPGFYILEAESWGWRDRKHVIIVQ